MKLFGYIRHLAVCLIICMLLCGCAATANNAYQTTAAAAEQTDEPTATPLPTPTVQPTPEPTPNTEPDDEMLCSLCEEEFSYLFELDFSRYDYASEGMLDMVGLIAKHSVYTQLCEEVQALADACAQAAVLRAKPLKECIENTKSEIVSELDWRLMAAVCVAEDDPATAVKNAITVSATIENGDTLSIKVFLPDFDALFSQSASESFHTALGLYSYLNTTYDDEAQLIDNSGEYELSSEYISTIIDPLPKRHIKNGWYGDRSKSTRRHMGTDIRADEWDEIPSCTFGTVIRIGYDPISGNYVTVKDDYGFYYSYCHMVELTTFLNEGDRVEAGQLIGHVGDTGNSDAPHLHLSIITPEYVYINPYPVLKRVRYGD